MKRILQIVSALQIGGLETVAMNCVRYSDRAKYQFDFLVFHDTQGGFVEEAKELGCNIYVVDEKSGGIVQWLHAVASVIREQGPYDVVHSHIFLKSGLVAYAAKKCGVPMVIAHAHSGKRSNDDRIDRKLYANMMRGLLNRYCDKFFACSRRAGEYVFGKQAFREKGSVLINAIPLNEFAYSAQDRAKLREELQILPEQTVIGQVGHLTGVKNQRFLLEMFAKYREKHNAVLLLVGDGELRGALEEQAKQLGIAQAVRMTGTRRDIGALLSAMDVFVLTSTREGLGIVLVEAMANGLQCICEESAIVEEVKNNRACNTVCGFAAEEWCRRIKEITETPRAVAPIDGEQLSGFALETFVSQMLTAYM